MASPRPPGRPPFPSCLVDSRPGCTWSAHRRKHFPIEGGGPEFTLHGNPARYAPEFTEPSIRRLETETARRPRYRVGTRAGGGKTEYLRDIGSAIGWDEGRVAELSYVECKGGESQGRTYHGRPMHGGNRTAVGVIAEGDA